jgi:hypothetical protein
MIIAVVAHQDARDHPHGTLYKSLSTDDPWEGEGRGDVDMLNAPAPGRLYGTVFDCTAFTLLILLTNGPVLLYRSQKRGCACCSLSKCVTVKFDSPPPDPDMSSLKCARGVTVIATQIDV